MGFSGNPVARTLHFPDGPVVKSLPCSTRDVGSIPGWGTKIAHAAGQLSPPVNKIFLKND